MQYLGERQLDVVVNSVDAGSIFSLRETFLRNRQRSGSLV